MTVSRIAVSRRTTRLDEPPLIERHSMITLRFIHGNHVEISARNLSCGAFGTGEQNRPDDQISVDFDLLLKSCAGSSEQERYIGEHDVIEISQRSDSQRGIEYVAWKPRQRSGRVSPPHPAPRGNRDEWAGATPGHASLTKRLPDHLREFQVFGALLDTHPDRQLLAIGAYKGTDPHRHRNRFIRVNEAPTATIAVGQRSIFAANGDK